MVGFVPVADYPESALFHGAGSLEHSIEELFKVVPEVNTIHLALTLLPCFIVVFGLYSGFIKERLYIGEAIIATVFGIIFSGYASGVFAPRTWGEGEHIDELTLELTRIIIALSVFAIGVELPKAYVLRHWRSLAVLLGPIMLIGWMVSASLIYALIPGLDFLPALVVAAGVTPTDPILAASVVGKGKFAQDHVPAHIRHILQAESGCNDGAAFPFLYIALFLLLRGEHSVGQAIGWWFVLVVLYQIILGCAIGAVIGVIARKLLKYSKRRGLIDRESMIANYIALALLVTGLTTLAGSDDLLAAFACGTAFAWDDWFTESIEESNFSSTIDLLANCFIFIYIGATMPFAAWSNPDLTLTPWRLAVLSICILVLRRLPGIFCLQYFIPDVKTRREAIFVGHFGPMGVGAIFICTLAAKKLPTPNYPPQTRLDILSLTLQPITYFIVLSSILVHGLTIGFFSVGRRVHSRVRSIKRTFTAASQAGDEPGWMSRVKRIRTGEDIIVNRDEGDLGEKSLPSKDPGALAMFGAPSWAGDTTASSGSSTGEEKRVPEELCRTDSRRDLYAERARENDDHPPKDILADLPDEEGRGREERTSKDLSRDATIADEETAIGLAKEANYSDRGDTTTWKEGRHIIIERSEGEDVHVVDVDPSQEAALKAAKDPEYELVEFPSHNSEVEQSGKKETVAEREASALRRYWRYQNSLLAATTALVVPKDDGLTLEQREKKRKEKLERDAWCRKEKHFFEDGVGEGRSLRDNHTEWWQGSKVVTEGPGEEISVRGLTEEEKTARAARHLAALKALGKPIEVIEAELSKITKQFSAEYDAVRHPDRPSTSKDKGKGTPRTSSDALFPPAAPASPPPTAAPAKSPGLSLTRTERIDEDDDDPTPSPSLPRPAPRPRANSRVRTMTERLFKRSNSVSRSPSPSRNIRFAEADRPARDGAREGRPLPVVGASLAIRRVPTAPAERDIRFAEEAKKETR